MKTKTQVADDLFNLGDYGAASAIYQELLQNSPTSAELLYKLGTIQKALGRTADAVALLERAIEIAPGNANYHNDLGTLLPSTGRLEDAILRFKHALLIDPTFAEAHNNLSLAYFLNGAPLEAEAEARKAVSFRSDYPEALNNLGNALLQLGRLEAALSAYTAALGYLPSYMNAQRGRIFTLSQLQKHQEAAASAELFLKIAADIEVKITLGKSLTHLRKFSEAHLIFMELAAIAPKHVGILHLLGKSKFQLRLFAGAQKIVSQALKFAPGDKQLLELAASTAFQLGNFSEARKIADELVALSDSQYEAAHRFSGMLFFTLADPSLKPDDGYSRFREFATRYEESFKPWRKHSNPRVSGKKLRIGYVSPDFRVHPVAFFLLPILESHDRHNFEIYCYYTNSIRDSITDRVEGLVGRFRDCHKLSDEDLDRQIRDDEIDILVDLSGHTDGHRLLVFARKPAPIQMTWLGCAATTGLTAMDYKITDSIADPPGMTESLHSETLIRLPCNAPFVSTSDWPPPGELPAVRNGFLTFGSLNSIYKLNDEVIRLWSRVLQAVPNARLLLGNANEEEVRASLQQKFSTYSVDVKRLEFQKTVPTTAFLELHQKIDVALDTFPYNGGTTSYYALRMGVPILTLAGDSAASRIGVTALHTAGLTEFIATSEEAYVQIALDCASNLARLSEIRSTLRSRIESNPIIQPRSIARNLESTFRSAWQEWCGKLDTESLESN